VHAPNQNIENNPKQSTIGRQALFARCAPSSFFGNRDGRALLCPPLRISLAIF
jgi:hypothetical protein